MVRFGSIRNLSRESSTVNTLFACGSLFSVCLDPAGGRSGRALLTFPTRFYSHLFAFCCGTSLPTLLIGMKSAFGCRGRELLRYPSLPLSRRQDVVHTVSCFTSSASTGRPDTQFLARFQVVYIVSNLRPLVYR